MRVGTTARRLIAILVSSVLLLSQGVLGAFDVKLSNLFGTGFTFGSFRYRLDPDAGYKNRDNYRQLYGEHGARLVEALGGQAGNGGHPDYGYHGR